MPGGLLFDPSRWKAASWGLAGWKEPVCCLAHVLAAKSSGGTVETEAPWWSSDGHPPDTWWPNQSNSQFTLGMSFLNQT